MQQESCTPEPKKLLPDLSPIMQCSESSLNKHHSCHLSDLNTSLPSSVEGLDSKGRGFLSEELLSCAEGGHLGFRSPLKSDNCFTKLCVNPPLLLHSYQSLRTNDGLAHLTIVSPLLDTSVDGLDKYCCEFESLVLVLRLNG